MKKRKHHYVWGHYLNAWTINDQICCKRPDKVFWTNLVNIANERDFYRIKELTIDDINLLKQLFVNVSNPVLNTLNSRWLEIFDLVIKFRNIMEFGIIDKTKQDDFDRIIFNFEEDLQTNVENYSIPYLQMIKEGNIEFYKNADDNAKFNYFLALQLLRTNKLKKNILKAFNKYPKYDFNSIWNVMIHIMATNFGFGLSSMSDRLHCVLLINKTSIPFLTSDQPIINTFADYTRKDIRLTVEQLELYYPQSPGSGLLITKEHCFRDVTELEIDESKVKQYNSMIVLASEEQLYSNDEKVFQ